MKTLHGFWRTSLEAAGSGEAGVGETGLINENEHQLSATDSELEPELSSQQKREMLEEKPEDYPGWPAACLKFYDCVIRGIYE